MVICDQVLSVNRTLEALAWKVPANRARDVFCHMATTRPEGSIGPIIVRHRNVGLAFFIRREPGTPMEEISRARAFKLAGDL